MLKFLPPSVKGGVVCVGMGLHTMVWVPLLMLASLFKFLLPLSSWRRGMTQVLIAIAELWMGCNNFLQRQTQSTRWQVDGVADLKHDGWYFVTSNHQSWSDILVLQRVFNRRIPMLKFFLKQELIWVPFMGMAWWALDFPFMQRFSREYLQAHPEMAGKDLEATRKACEKFRHVPVSVVNFMEGTRFTQDKHDAQASPYQHLLKPRAGGSSFVLSAMGEQMHSLLDVTIYYPGTRHSFWDFVTGRIEQIVVHVESKELPVELIVGDYENDPVFRQKFQSWVNQLWQDKDALLARLSAGLQAAAR